MSKQEQERVIENVRRRLNEEASLVDPTKIVTTMEKRGGLFNRHHVVQVSGKISNEAERKRILDAVGSGVAGHDVEIDDQLVIPIV
ncbi:MAG: hypothetical protein ACLFR8_01960 [Alkalispirochaeta sp.]